MLALATVREDSPTLHTQGKLIFHGYGKQYFLAEIWGAEATKGVLFSPSKQEKHMQQIGSGPSTTGKGGHDCSQVTKLWQSLTREPEPRVPASFCVNERRSAIPTDSSINATL